MITQNTSANLAKVADYVNLPYQYFIDLLAN